MNVMVDDVLAKICADKRAEIAEREAARKLDELKAEVKDAGKTRGFARALMDVAAAGQAGLIAEIKKASPSGGLIRPDFEPAALAQAYEAAGAACLSVLTDAKYFQGTAEHLQAARAAVELPVLRKDFMLDEWQIYESRAMGADCILLIMAALEDAQARELEGLARALDMDVLVEVHDAQELERALMLQTPLLGVNNRNLKTMVTDIATTEALSRLCPPNKFLISESGIKTNQDVERLRKVCVQGFLVGESLMRHDDVGAAVHALLGDMTGLTHIGADGAARMVDVSAKPVTAREAEAKGRVVMKPETASLIRDGQAAKGDVLAAARIAGIMAAKKTGELIPLCHPLPLDAVSIELIVTEDAVEIAATARTTGRTGVEMEALTAVSVAALTIYDMVKAVDKTMRIEAVRLTRKTGGKSGDFSAP